MGVELRQSPAMQVHNNSVAHVCWIPATQCFSISLYSSLNLLNNKNCVGLATTEIAA